MASFKAQKQRVLNLFDAIEEANEHTIASVFETHVATDYSMRGCYPLNELASPSEAVTALWQPLLHAFGSMQRRQDVFIAGKNQHDDKVWVMSMGHFMGLFDNDWLGIRATHQTTMLRYCEFYCVENDQIVESSFFCDILGLMQQIGLNPLPLQTGASFLVPGPRTNDGVHLHDTPVEQGQYTLEVVNKMVDDLTQLNISGDDNCPPELLAKRWHDNMVWYGPAGIGSVHTIERYQRHHQYPFRQGLSDKVFNGHIARFAEGDYACFFGWPNLSNTAIGGFLGLPGGNARADMRVIDVYRREGDKLAENWVIIDIPYWLKQQGLDILQRTTQISNPC